MGMKESKQEKKQRKLPPPSTVVFIGKGTIFAVSLGLNIYLIGILGGGWLDRRLGTEPIFFFVGILIAFFTSFYYLFKAFFSDDTNKDTSKTDDGADDIS